MSMMSKAVHDAAVSSKRAGGSFATQQNRRLDTTGLLRFARQVGEMRTDARLEKRKATAGAHHRERA